MVMEAETVEPDIVNGGRVGGGGGGGLVAARVR